MLRLLLGRDQNQITRAVLRGAVESPAAGSLVIVPEQYSHVTERRLCELGGDTVSARCEVLTFSRLAHRVFQECGGSARPVLDQGGRLLLMHLAVSRLASELTIYGRAGKKASFLSSLLATAEECKSYCITPQLLLEAGASAPERGGQRLRELGLILGAYDALTMERAEDPRDRLTRLAQALKRANYLTGKAVFLDGFTDFTPQERLVLEVMLRRARSVTVGLRCDTLEPEGLPLFAPTRQTAVQLVRLARENGSGMEYEVLTGDTARPDDLDWLEKNLFALQPEQSPVPAEHIALTPAEHPYQELELVAGEILRLVREEGFRYREITVAARSLEEWSGRMETVFRRYGIPVFLSRMDDILQKPILTLITAALDAVSGGYEYDDVFRYLKTDLTGIGREERDRLENYVLRWDIRGSRWTQEKPWPWHPEGYGQPWNDEVRAEVAALDALRRQIVAPLERLRKSGASTGREQAQALYAFLEAIDLPACLERRTRELTAAGALREAEEYGQLWEILVGVLEQCSDLLGEDTLSLAEFAQLFQLVLSQYQVGTIPVSLDRVTCGDMARISHSTGKVLFLVGAEDNSLPQVHQDTGLLTREDRALIAELGVETPLTPDQRMDRELLLIYECCTMATHRLYLSYSAQSMEGTEQRPAFFLHRVAQLFPGGVERCTQRGLPGAIGPALEDAARRGDAAALSALAELPGGEAGALALEAMDLKRERLTPEAVKELYRGTLRMSASRMDKVKSCHYAYFLQYGLKAKPRKRADLDAPESGTFVHFVLEFVLGRARERGGIAQISDEEVEALCKEAARNYLKEQIGGAGDKAPRFNYLFRRLADSAVEVVRNMVEELRCSDFEPIAFELGFGTKEELPPVQLDVEGVRVSISGFVDRVDGWVHDGRLYLRVLDYKTGRKSFQFTDIWHGLNLQMLLYLFTLQEKGLPGVAREIVPAGVLYLPAREEKIAGPRSMEEEQRLKQLDKALQRSGLILNEPDVVEAMEHIPEGGKPRFLPVRVSKGGQISGECLASAEQLGKLRRHIDKVIRDIAREVGGGNISADPCYRSEQDIVCRYCDYAPVCHFDDGSRGEHRHYLYPVSGKQFWERMEEEAEKGGDRV